MDVKSGYPWWTVRNGLLNQYPPLEGECGCDVLVVGAGVTGALVADAMMQAGLDTVVIDRRDVGWGSTAASTALLQYEIDTELRELARLVGKADAEKAYKACEGAVELLGDLASGLGDVGFRETRSLYYASYKRHVKRLRDECSARRAIGIDVELLDAPSLRDRFGVQAPAALLSGRAAEVDPYRFTHALLARQVARGLRVYDRSELKKVEYEASGIRAYTSDGIVHAQYLVFACGYETEKFVPERLARNRSSYAFVSEPLAPMPEFLKTTIGWETARPYLYWRSTDDDRLVVGGEDDAIDNALKRDLQVGRKSEKLLKRMAKALPGVSLAIGFAWAGTFAETRDGLPYFGRHPQCDPRVQFAMAYGGNGITYSVLGARILRDAILGHPNELSGLFGFHRTAR